MSALHDKTQAELAMGYAKSVESLRKWGLLLILILVGCAGETQYIRPFGVTEEMAQRDSYECNLQASQSTQGTLANPRYSIVTMMIVHSHQKQKVMNDCMFSKGYVLQASEGSDSDTTSGSHSTPTSTTQASEDEFNQSSYLRLAKKYEQMASSGKEGALDQVKALAEEGDIEWQFFLGMFYFMGQQAPLNRLEVINWYKRVEKEGKPGDLEQAVNWFQRAATQGHLAAQGNLGLLYYAGLGVRKDLKKSLHWLLEAAQQGYGKAQFMLGHLYGNGEGVPQDYIHAHMWLNLAAAQGDEDARKDRDVLAKAMSPAQIAEAQRLASEWKPKGR